MSAQSAQHQLRQHIYGDVPLYVAVFSGKRGKNGVLNSTHTAYFQWPQDAAKITRETQRESGGGREAYQCAHLLTKKRRIKENAAQISACYVDGDGAQPGPDQPQPTAIVESSPGRHQFYYRLTEAIDPVRAEKINRRLAAAMGADMSGWDLTQILRPLDTHNWKYQGGPNVRLISIEDRAYDPDELERILPELPDETVPRTTVKLERSAVAIPLGDRDQRTRERMYAGRRGSEIQQLANGSSIHRKPDGSPDHSADDQSYLNGLACWFDRDASRMAAEARRSGRVREKWNEIHSSSGETYLEMTIGKAIPSCSQSFRELTGYDAGDAPPQLAGNQPPARLVHGTDGASTCLTDEPATLEDALALVAQLRQEITEYRDSNNDCLAWIERLAGFNEELQASNATLSIKLTRETELRAVERQMELDKQRIRRKLKPMQAESIIALATIGPPIANSLGKDPYVTAKTVANVAGGKEATVRKNLGVLDLAGSPVARTTVTLGTKSLTAYDFAGMDTPALLTALGDFAENLGAPPKLSRERVRCHHCPEGTTQTAATICDGCHRVLARRKLEAPNVQKNTTLETPPPHRGCTTYLSCRKTPRWSRRWCSTYRRGERAENPRVE